MTTVLQNNPTIEAATIAAQNDAFRKSIMFFNDAEETPKGQFVMTSGVDAMGPDARLAATRQVAAFEAFTMNLARLRSLAQRSGSRLICMTSIMKWAQMSQLIRNRRVGF